MKWLQAVNTGNVDQMVGHLWCCIVKSYKNHNYYGKI